MAGGSHTISACCTGLSVSWAASGAARRPRSAGRNVCSTCPLASSADVRQGLTAAAPGASRRLPAAATHRRPLSRPGAFCPDFRASPTYAPDPEEAVSYKYRGLPPPALHQAFCAEHPGLLEAVAGAAQGMAPATAAQLLRMLQAELPPALNDVAPGGDCVLVAITPGLLPLLERAGDCCEASLRGGELALAAAAARAALSLLSCLRFGCGESAAPYAAVAVRCKQALKAAYDAGAIIAQEDVVELEAACARASSWLWLTPYAGQRYASAVGVFVSSGWASAELAVRYAEAYSRLLTCGRYQAVEHKYVRVVRAAMGHRLSLEQTERLLSAAQRLPVEMSIALALQARSQPAADWHSQLLRMHQEREQERLQRRRLQHTLANRSA
ncbi:expressed protein, partial [Chlorella variabilis]